MREPRWIKAEEAIAILIPLRDYSRVPSPRRVNPRRRQKSDDLIERWRRRHLAGIHFNSADARPRIGLSVFSHLRGSRRLRFKNRRLNNVYHGGESGR